jgi:hypothetical protein
MFVPLTSAVVDFGTFYESLARAAMAIAAWASVRAERTKATPEQAMKDLTLRLQHPWKYRAQQVTRLFK